MSASLPMNRDLREPTDADGIRRVTGRTVLGWLIAFFGVIFAANAALIYLAVGSFPGLEVDSSYKAGQQFSEEVAAAAEQAARGWNVDVHAAREGAATSLTAHFADKAGVPERGLRVTASLHHPTDQHRDLTANLGEIGPGIYSVDMADVAPGSWTLVVEAFEGGTRVFRSRNAIMLGR